jgi:Na+:H+ antiporter, NhaA family
LDGLNIALAVRVVAMLASPVPAAAKLFLLTLAIANDILAIYLIALVYSDEVELGWLLVPLARLVGVLLLPLCLPTAVLHEVLVLLAWWSGRRCSSLPPSPESPSD